MSKIMLRETDLAVTDIAMETGFRSLSSFAKTFLNREGVSPSVWRSSRSRS
ncbi:MAG: helix-turn-helix domain-containing protein [Balneolaceae bacterium]